MTLRRAGGVSGASIGLIAVLLGLPGSAPGQQPAPNLAVCDSIVAAARADSVDVGLFVSIARIDGAELTAGEAQVIAGVVGSAFIAPRPLRLSIFAGPIRTRILRSRASDTTPELQAPTITGVYRFSAAKGGALSKVQVVRAPLIPGFDSAATAAIGVAAATHGLTPPAGEDSMRVEVRFSTDSTAGGRRIVSASFPRMPVVSAMPLRDNPPPTYPEDEKGDSATTGEVVFRFVVDRDGNRQWRQSSLCAGDR